MATVALTRQVAVAAPPGSSPAKTPIRVLLREALQYENIGDVGRVPGTIRLLYQHLPSVQVTLWPWSLHQQERVMLERNFPELRIAVGEIDDRGRSTNSDLDEAWRTSHFFLSPARRATTYAQWAATGRPYGLFGSAFDPLTNRNSRPDGDTLEQLRQGINSVPQGALQRQYGDRTVFEKANFIFCRDSLSLQFLRQQNLQPTPLAFGPDSTFAIAVRDEKRADDWLRRNDLADQDFICVLPRLRYTPYYRVKNLPRSEADYTIDALNARSATSDHAPLREVITRWVEKTGGKVIACPEMTYQIQTAKEQLVDPLPDKIKKHVVWRDVFWLPDEAASIYARARALVSMECHSPIIALANGTPAIHIRNPVDTVKGQMFRDIGVGDWLFEVGETAGEEMWKALQIIHEDLPSARRRVQACMAQLSEVQRTMTLAIAKAVADSS